MFGSEKTARGSTDSSSDGARERLLDSDSENGHILPLQKSHKSSFHIPLWAHGILLSLYTIGFLLLVLYGRPEGKSGSHLPLPSREGLVWEERRFPTDIVDNPFTGEPREELDEAWHKLLKNDNILVPKDYLDEKSLHSVYTKDGDEGVASLAVYHSLHCLKKVKRMLFKEHYHKDKTGDAMAREEKHVDHCVEYIREALMCQPDLSLVTFRWINNTAQHADKSGFWPTNFDVDAHRCANWEALDSWAGQRAFNLFEVEKLDRPMPE
ncbi:hypothetical protein ISF_09180 [Cordyceps fumosorosea ARSEF 2679]|uniref:Tat pathway signal sequence n=1 Tax=Cordyceps fumosorosea (strain ARSEF 2679) TaxID=1081104 RepID=A0A167LBW3_CORFA|nr:hypothetical protein ISF_09180 [Cordyceps fumosorosea ARSEF 2679]OAA52902.1 hypothetical protein ISF_09180 [Cordyceps fumosorosea ARSEF 2679]